MSFNYNLLVQHESYEVMHLDVLTTFLLIICLISVIYTQTIINKIGLSSTSFL
jgi:hypothetical protein